jgi:hypothetical protein
MASTDTIMGAMFALSGVVIVVGLVIHYMRPNESGTKPQLSKPQSTLGGVIRLLMIVIGLFIAIAVIDFVSMSICSGGIGASIPPIQWR